MGSVYTSSERCQRLSLVMGVAELGGGLLVRRSEVFPTCDAPAKPLDRSTTCASATQPLLINTSKEPRRWSRSLGALSKKQARVDLCVVCEGETGENAPELNWEVAWFLRIEIL